MLTTSFWYLLSPCDDNIQALAVSSLIRSCDRRIYPHDFRNVSFFCAWKSGFLLLQMFEIFHMSLGMVMRSSLLLHHLACRCEFWPYRHDLSPFPSPWIVKLQGWKSVAESYSCLERAGLHALHSYCDPGNASNAIQSRNSMHPGNFWFYQSRLSYWKQKLRYFEYFTLALGID